METENHETVETVDCRAPDSDDSDWEKAWDFRAADAENRQTAEDSQPPEEDYIKVKKMPAWARIAIASVVAIVILFAFIWEFGNIGARIDPDAEIPQGSGSPVQDAIDDLDWIIPAYLPVNDYSRPGTKTDEISGIVVHYIGNPGTTASQNRNYFANLAITEEAYASSNFIIGLDGEVLQCVPVDEIAYASNDRNSDTLSIELCHPDDTGEFTDETYASAVRLAAWLCSEYELSGEDILRHFDVSGKECPRYFVQNGDAWETFKADVTSAMDG